MFPQSFLIEDLRSFLAIALFDELFDQVLARPISPNQQDY